MKNGTTFSIDSLRDYHRQQIQQISIIYVKEVTNLICTDYFFVYLCNINVPLFNKKHIESNEQMSSTTTKRTSHHNISQNVYFLPPKN